MLVTFEEPPYAIKVTPAHPPLLPGLLPARPPPARLAPAAGGPGSAAHTGSGGGADINMADAFPLCGVCEQQ